MIHFYPLDQASKTQYDHCHICGDNRDIDFYTVDDEGNKRLTCRNCVEIIQKNQMGIYGMFIDKDPLEKYRIARVVRFYKTKNGITVGEFGFLDGIYIKIDISIYGYWFIPKHINAYTLIYDERLKGGMIDTDEIVKGNPTVIIYSENFAKPKAVVIHNNYEIYNNCNYKVINFDVVEEREKYFDPIFKDRDVKDIFFVDKRKKCEFDEWI